MSREGITIEGLDDCLACLNEAPGNLLKMSKKALQDATREATRKVRQRTPVRWRPMVKYKIKRNPVKDTISGAFGLYNNREVNGHQNPSGDPAFDWFKAYWNNYGTLSRRDPSHAFQQPIRPDSNAAAKRRRNTTGVPAQHFFEASIAGWEDVFVNKFKDSLKKQEDELCRR